MLRLFTSYCAVAIVMLTGAARPATASQDPSPPTVATLGDNPSNPAEPNEESETVAGTTTQVDIEELERRIEVLADEVERLRSGETPVDALDAAEARALGLSPSAASAYGVERGVSIAGYGEMLYENFASDATSRLDYLRAIVYAGYRFNDRFIFNSEIEIEHGKEIFVEFAYVDWLARDNFGVRAGMLLIPMGLINEFHEPTVFLGAERPVTERSIIPATWRENGAGVYGTAGDILTYRAYVVNGFDGSAFSATGLRGGRQKGVRAKADDMAFTGRVDITPTPGVFFGGGVYIGNSGQGDIEVDGVDHGVRTRVFDLHGQAQLRGFDVRALYAQADLDDTAALNRALGLTGSKGIAKTMRGGYIQLGYDVLSQVPAAAGVGLTPYLRYEKVDTQAALAAGFTRDPSTNNTFTTFGVELKPIPNIVVKFDHMWVDNSADSGVNQFNVNVGYTF